MTKDQKAFLENMTATKARAILAKFDNCPKTADQKSGAAYHAFCTAFELLNPGEYVQRQKLAGLVRYNYISAA